MKERGGEERYEIRIFYFENSGVANKMVEAVASEVVVDVATVVDADDERSKAESQ